MDETVKVNVLGCCTSRDIFPSSQKEFEVQQCITIASPMSSAFPKPAKPMVREDLAGFKASAGLNYRSRVTMLDNNKACFEYIGAEPSDYIVVDIADIRLSIVHYGGATVSQTGFIVSNQKEFKRVFGEFSVQRFDEFSDQEWEDCIRKYCKCILNLYPAERIVLNEVVLGEEYVSKQGRICAFPKTTQIKRQKINHYLDSLYLICEEELKGCHVLKMPKGIIADARHKFGLHPLHFHRLYYEYGLAAMKIVADDLDGKECRLATLHEYYSEKFTTLRLSLEKRIYLFDNNKLKAYMDYFLYLLQHPEESMGSVIRFVQEHGIRSVALYGDFKSTEALMFYLDKANVSVDYIIGMWNHHKGIKLVRPAKEGENYPETGSIINCDVMNLLNGSEALRKVTSIPVYDIYDILPNEQLFIDSMQTYFHLEKS
ncbi:DUF6270 domain-containing protein [Selenomonas sp. KH1T6]|uniref:DUF6270 domain-containing protein n=1 Tax=Selenomonas sp. KH1T6 TaxID=3158784 RepID=UPI0008A762E3|nr:hypothetical protein SAMN05216583_11858 [Selenomonas ruminantium]